MFIQTDLCPLDERGLCTAKNTHRNFNELNVLKLSKNISGTREENHKMSWKCLSDVRCYR